MRQRLATSVASPHLVDSPAIRVILLRKIAAPYCRICGSVRERDDPVKRIERFLFALHDVGKERRAAHSGNEPKRRDGDQSIQRTIRPVKWLPVRILNQELWRSYVVVF